MSFLSKLSRTGLVGVRTPPSSRTTLTQRIGGRMFRLRTVRGHSAKPNTAPAATTGSSVKHIHQQAQAQMAPIPNTNGILNGVNAVPTDATAGLSSRPRSSSNPRKMSFIGAGNMAEALVQGLMTSDVLPEDCRVSVSDVNSNQLTKLGAVMDGIGCDIDLVSNNKEAVADSDVVFLSVTPQVLPLVLDEIHPLITEDTLIVSIAAGVTTNTIHQQLVPNGSVEANARRIIRVMPNTPALCGALAGGMCGGRFVREDDLKNVSKWLSGIGQVHVVEEDLLNGVAGLSGSGPAYVFMFIEALADGGVSQGLSREVAQNLAVHTVLGSAQLLLKSGRHPAELKDMVSSPGGATICAVEQLERLNFRHSVISAVKASAEKSASFVEE